MKTYFFIQGDIEDGNKVIKILENLGGSNNYSLYNGRNDKNFYYIDVEDHNYIKFCNFPFQPSIDANSNRKIPIYDIETFEKNWPYTINQKVLVDNEEKIIKKMKWDSYARQVMYSFDEGIWTECKDFSLVEDYFDIGEMTDGYHSFNELYEYRLLYNAALFNEFARQGLYKVHKSKLHSDGEIPFGNPNWFIVMAELPTGQISNHYEMKYWNLFKIPEQERSNPYDGHSPVDVAERMMNYLKLKN